MAVPTYLLLHTVTLVKPAITVDAYNSPDYDYGPAATRVSAMAWLQQEARSRVAVTGAKPLQERWTLITNAENVERRDRVEWTGPSGAVIFELDGQPEPVYTPAGFHHTEVALVRVDG